MIFLKGLSKIHCISIDRNLLFGTKISAPIPFPSERSYNFSNSQFISAISRRRTHDCVIVTVMAPKEGSKRTSTDAGEIAADGDVVLIVGPNKRKLRVHSLFLKTASKVLEMKLRPDSSEVQDISNHDTQAILLPEDDEGAMKTLCAVIHLSSDAASDALTPGEVLKVAIAAEKYGCIVALRNASGHWLKSAENASIEDLKVLMAAAYLFDATQAFEDITAALILHHTDSYLALAQDQVGSLLPRRVFCEYPICTQPDFSVDVTPQACWRNEEAKHA